jgi:hypothetical protein
MYLEETGGGKERRGGGSGGAGETVAITILCSSIITCDELLNSGLTLNLYRSWLYSFPS